LPGRKKLPRPSGGGDAGVVSEDGAADTAPLSASHGCCTLAEEETAEGPVAAGLGPRAGAGAAGVAGAAAGRRQEAAATSWAPPRAPCEAPQCCGWGGCRSAVKELEPSKADVGMLPSRADMGLTPDAPTALVPGDELGIDFKLPKSDMPDSAEGSPMLRLLAITPYCCCSTVGG